MHTPILNKLDTPGFIDVLDSYSLGEALRELRDGHNSRATGLLIEGPTQCRLIYANGMGEEGATHGCPEEAILAELHEIRAADPPALAAE